MASLANDPGGTRRILVMVEGKRRTIRLGDLPKRQAEGILREVEALSSSRIDGSAPPEKTAKWLAGIDSKLRERLAKAGLIEKAVEKTPTTFASGIDDYRLTRFPSLKVSTQQSYNVIFARIVAGIGGAVDMATFSEADADDFHRWLMTPKPDGGGLGRATANQTCAVAWALFRRAIRRRLVGINPFDDVDRSVMASKKVYISTADAEAILAAITDTQERLLFGLARWGGLRIPSEPERLLWRHVDWERQRFLVHSPKTERHEGRATRWVPIFPELAPLFDERYSDAQEGDEYVLPITRSLTGAALGSRLRAKIGQAGLEQHTRVWHSLRATRQTELVSMGWPAHVVCAWIGNSREIAQRHYLSVTDSDFAKAAQKAAQPLHATERNDLQRDPSASAESA